MLMEARIELPPFLASMRRGSGKGGTSGRSGRGKNYCGRGGFSKGRGKGNGTDFSSSGFFGGVGYYHPPSVGPNGPQVFTNGSGGYGQGCGNSYAGSAPLTPSQGYGQGYFGSVPGGMLPRPGGLCP